MLLFTYYLTLTKTTEDTIVQTYEKMSKKQLLNELLDYGISIFNEMDSKEILIEALYQEIEYDSKYPEAVQFTLKKSQW